LEGLIEVIVTEEGEAVPGAGRLKAKPKLKFKGIGGRKLTFDNKIAKEGVGDDAGLGLAAEYVGSGANSRRLGGLGSWEQSRGRLRGSRRDIRRNSCGCYKLCNCLEDIFCSTGRALGMVNPFGALIGACCQACERFDRVSCESCRDVVDAGATFATAFAGKLAAAFAGKLGERAGFTCRKLRRDDGIIKYAGA
jgi:hypothetical protein